MQNLKVKIIEACTVPIADIEGKSDPYIVLKLAGQQKKTSTKFSSLDPVWNETFIFESIMRDHTLHLIMYDQDPGDHEVIARRDIDLQDLPYLWKFEQGVKKPAPLYMWLDLLVKQGKEWYNADDTPRDSKLLVELLFEPATSATESTTQEKKGPGTLSAGVASHNLLTEQETTRVHTTYIKHIEHCGLPKTNTDVLRLLEQVGYPCDHLPLPLPEVTGTQGLQYTCFLEMVAKCKKEKHLSALNYAAVQQSGIAQLMSRQKNQSAIEDDIDSHDLWVVLGGNPDKSGTIDTKHLRHCATDFGIDLAQVMPTAQFQLVHPEEDDSGGHLSKSSSSDSIHSQQQQQHYKRGNSRGSSAMENIYQFSRGKKIPKNVNFSVFSKILRGDYIKEQMGSRSGSRGSHPGRKKTFFDIALAVSNKEKTEPEEARVWQEVPTHDGTTINCLILPRADPTRFNKKRVTKDDRLRNFSKKKLPPVANTHNYSKRGFTGLAIAKPAIQPLNDPHHGKASKDTKDSQGGGLGGLPSSHSLHINNSNTCNLLTPYPDTEPQLPHVQSISTGPFEGTLLGTTISTSPSSKSKVSSSPLGRRLTSIHQNKPTIDFWTAIGQPKDIPQVTLPPKQALARARVAVPYNHRSSSYHNQAKQAPHPIISPNTNIKSGKVSFASLKQNAVSASFSHFETKPHFVAPLGKTPLTHSFG